MKNLKLSDIKNKINFEHGIYNEEKIKKFAVMALLSADDNGELSFIFQERNLKIRQGGEVSFPGGAFEEENDKSLMDTAVRETSEEMGISVESLEVLGQLDTIFTHTNMFIEAFLGISSVTTDNFKPNKDEVSRIFAVPLDFFLNTEPEFYQILLQSSSVIKDAVTNEDKVIFPAKELGLPKMYHKYWNNSFRTVPLYKFNGDIIWGFTAQIVLNFVQKIKNEKH